MGWIFLLVAFLFFIAVRRTPVIQFLAGFLLLFLVVGFLFPMPGHFGVLERGRFWQVAGGLMAYKADHQGALPDRLSQLFPDYMNSKDISCFFDRRGKDFEERCKKAAADPTEVDRDGAIDYFAGKVGGMLAASKTPIEKEDSSFFSKPRKKLFRLILENDGKIKFLPEEEYQRRLTDGLPK